MESQETRMAKMRIARQQEAEMAELAKKEVSAFYADCTMLNKDLIIKLLEYPMDAKVCVECCDIRKMIYNKSDNTIRID